MSDAATGPAAAPAPPSAGPPAPAAAAHATSRPTQAVASPLVAFRYTGGRQLTARGAVTGRMYRFAAPGAVVAVDPRDAPGFLAVPNLRRV